MNKDEAGRFEVRLRLWTGATAFAIELSRRAEARNGGRMTGLPSRSPRWRAKAGDPGLIRTGDLQFRKLLLYPSELRGHAVNFTGLWEQQFRKLLVDSRSGP